MNRRTLLRTAGVGVAGSMTGCANLFQTRTVGRSPPMVQNRPDAVYVPSHVEGMEMAGMAKRGRLRLALFYSFPHRFWLMGGGTAKRQKKVEIQSEDDVHLMASAWDAKTKRVLPAGNVRITLSNGDWSATRTMWPMLSQNMGFHFGDNLSLDGDGTYEAEVKVGGLDFRKTGALAGQFDGTETLTTTFDYSQSTKEDIAYRRLDDRKGERDAVDRMDMRMPVSHVPKRANLPGQFRGEVTTGDAPFLVSTVADGPLANEGTYLLVSPRTPYNRYPLPMTSLSTTLTRDGETSFEGALTPTLDPDAGYHYGTSVDGVASGDELAIRVESPPQVSRHEGYETAFVGMETKTLAL
ncbi:iron transporter [Halomicrococcus sp. SG-WS-1]|uniref:iron transporter n=1 Tax=Halomicrococcus sp. SG-WS-1 TaxID=3439057 RepID=UPI003F7A506C